jgi:hypothetical protein
MNKDIRLSVDFFEHPKTIKLIRVMGLEGVVCLQRLWCFAGKYRPEGVFTDMDALDIEIAAKWTGSPGDFIQGMIKLRWLDLTDDVYSLHDWSDHNGFAIHAREREIQARNAAEKRWKKRYGSKEDADSNADCNADSIPDGNAPSPTPLPLPNPSPNPTPKACSGAVNGEPTRTEKMILETIEEHREMLSEKFPDADIDLEATELCAKYRDVAIGCDAWIIVSRWFKNLADKNSRSSPPKNKTDYDALLAEYEAEHGGTSGL